MKKKLIISLFSLLLLAFYSCTKKEKESLEQHLKGKWGVYDKTDQNSENILRVFVFRDDGKMYDYSSLNTSGSPDLIFDWRVENNQLKIILIENSSGQGDPIMFPNASQGDPIMINVDEWEQGDPIMYVSLNNNSYTLKKT